MLEKFFLLLRWLFYIASNFQVGNCDSTAYYEEIYHPLTLLSAKDSKENGKMVLIVLLENTDYPALLRMLDEQDKMALVVTYDVAAFLVLQGLVGFPDTVVLSEEAAKSMGENEEAIEANILLKMIVAGFSTVTITSVFVTSILVCFIE